MSWFGITITDTQGNVKKGVRYDPSEDLEAYTAQARRLAISAMKGTFQHIAVVILADDSPELMEHIVKRRAYYEHLWAEQAKEKKRIRNSNKPPDPAQKLFADPTIPDL